MVQVVVVIPVVGVGVVVITFFVGGKLYQAKACADLKHPKAFKRSFISHNAYLMLLGSHILHPFPVFFTKKFSQENIYKPQQTLVNT